MSDIAVPIGVFGVAQNTLTQLVETQSQDILVNLGGITGLTASLKSSQLDGIHPDELKVERQEAFGRNVFEKPPSPSLIWLMWEVLKDKTLLMLLAAASVSLVVAFFRHEEEGPTSWLDGAAILVAVAIVVIVSAVNDWLKDRHFQTLAEKRGKRSARVIRAGQEILISTEEVLVGDIVLLEAGDFVPADGIVVSCHSLACDESSVTGESATVHKQVNNLVISGTMVTKGLGQMLTLAVGKTSCHGRLLSQSQGPKPLTPLQCQLNILAEKIAKLGMAASALLFFLLMGHFFLTNGFKISFLMLVDGALKAFIQAVTLLVVAVPEGLPMAVTVALAFASSRMIEDNNLVRVSSACETMGCATTICSDKTGTLTTNKMTVVSCVIAGKTWSLGPNHTPPRMYNDELKSLLLRSFILNSTASIGSQGAVGSQTEIALLNFSQQLDPQDPLEMRKRYDIVDVEPFSSENKQMTTVVKCDEKLFVFKKGAPDVLLSECSLFLEEDVSVVSLDLEKRTDLENILLKMAQAGLRTLLLAYSENGGGLVLLGLFGIEDPLRPEVLDAVVTCQKAGIFVRMVTGDNIETAGSIARKAGILTRGGLLFEGPKFRTLDESELDRVVPKLQVLARSSPLDKQILVRKLQQLGGVVAVTGDGSNDAPALRAANVSFAMGITGTEVAKAAADIVLLDDRFSSIVGALAWGRCIGDSVRKFLVFQLTVNVSAVGMAALTAFGENGPVFGVLELLWVNLLMDTLGALALATDRPSQHLLERQPEGLRRNLVTFAMWKRILGVAFFQILTLLLLLVLGAGRTFVFNVFVMMQLWNEIACRAIPGVDSVLRSLDGLEKNWMFLGVFGVSIIGQVLIVEFGGSIFGTTSIGPKGWILSIAIGFLVLPIVFLVDWFMPRRIEREISEPTDISTERLQWQAAIADVRRGLYVFGALRRVRGSNDQ